MLLAVTVLLVIASTLQAPAQSAAGRVSFGAHYGLSKYWGSFTDNQFWQGGDIYLRWNIIPFISLHGMFGISQLRYRVNAPKYSG